MTEDEKFEAFVGREARRFNEPPAEVPREEMWEVIAAARTASRPVAGGAGSSPDGRRDHLSLDRARPRRPLHAAPWIGMAATLVLGLGIGRYMIARDMGTLPGIDTLAVAVAESDAAPSTPVQGPVDSPRLAATRPPATRSPAPAPAAPRASQRTSTPDAEAGTRRDGASSTYAVASRQHLTRAEALVAVVAAMPADAALDSLTGRWARDVLTNTRLLLDSPAGDDPVRRRLLEDLESVLVQLVQRSGRPAEDRAMIDRTLQKTQILTRLRSGATGT